MRPPEQLPIGTMLIEDAPIQPKHPPEPNPNEAHHLIEPAPMTDFLVQFTVSGLMLVHAGNPVQANEKATAFLQGLSANTGTPTDSLAEGGGQVKLGETIVVIDDVQALELPQELPNTFDTTTP